MTMIKNLPVQLNSAGHIKIGIKGEMITSAKGKEFRPPQKLDHFRITTTERDDNGDYRIDTVLTKAIIDNGNCRVNAKGNLTGVPIRLLYNTIEENFPNQYACYSSGKLICSGDGEVSRKRIDDFAKDHPCPCARLSPDHEGNDKCKPTGKLTCIIDEAGLFGQAHTFRTTSLNSVKGILGGLDLLQTATKGRLAGLPLMLTLDAKQTATPAGIPTTVYIVSVCYRGSMSDLRHEVLTLLSQEKQYLIGMDTVAQRESFGLQPGSPEEQEFVEEFFPDAVIVEGSTAKVVQDAIDDTKVECETSKPEPEPEPEPEEIESIEGDDGQEIHLAGRLMIGGGTYNTIYNKFMYKLRENDPDEALKLANRLTKDMILTWFYREQPDIELDPGLKKPELIDRISSLFGEHDGGPILAPDAPIINHDLVDNDKVDKAEPTECVQPVTFIDALKSLETQKEVADAVSLFFRPTPINRTLGIPELIDSVEKALDTQNGVEAEPKEPAPKAKPDPEHEEEVNPEPETPKEEPKTNAEKFPQQWDAESGPVQVEQLRFLVQLKANLERQGLLKSTPQAWAACVSYFYGEDGQPLDTAKKLTSKQCESFIKILEIQLEKNEDLIPF